MYRKPEKALGQSRRNVLFSPGEKKTGEPICRSRYNYSLVHENLRYALRRVICSAVQMHAGVQPGYKGPNLSMIPCREVGNTTGTFLDYPGKSCIREIT